MAAQLEFASFFFGIGPLNTLNILMWFYVPHIIPRELEAFGDIQMMIQQPFAQLLWDFGSGQPRRDRKWRTQACLGSIFIMNNGDLGLFSFRAYRV